MEKKSPDAFRTISEVSEWLETPTHVLRFWESKFNQVKPVKRAGGRRYYRPADMLLLGGIKKLLHEDGMTIRGAQKLLREQGVKKVSALSQPLDGEDAIEAPMAENVEEAPLSDNVVELPKNKPRLAPEAPSAAPARAPLGVGLPDDDPTDEDQLAQVISLRSLVLSDAARSRFQAASDVQKQSTLSRLKALRDRMQSGA
ncbi:MerR family transcriptional regulator [Actibacterium atlanticum]|uniref:MerR family transcriptional regulator n=1 Tax=Actibacterium atlanticum TaxID=1461693 RepID=A0A058ZQD8_9RHOB|nr:MerR family transcriptional regulator [Actibacterium atlanticum]KCV83748.1 MerR family transcriptional regulator [Actibacterium atlanticum]